MVTLCLLVLSLQCAPKSFFFFTNPIAAISLQFHDESKQQMPFNLVELKHREYKDFVQSLPQIYFGTWKQNWAGGNISKHLWLQMMLLEAGGFGVHFGNRRHPWKYVFLRDWQAMVDFRRNQKTTTTTTCSHLPPSCRQRRVSSHLACITFLYLAAEPESSLQHLAFGDFLWLCHIPWRSSESWNRWRD